MKGHIEDDTALTQMLDTYTVEVDTRPAAVNELVRRARVRAVQLRQEMEEGRLLTLVARALGFQGSRTVAWSALAGASLALLIGVSLGASNIVPGGDEQMISVDFDSVVGIGAATANADAAL